MAFPAGASLFFASLHGNSMSLHGAVRRCAQEGSSAATLLDSIVTFPEHARAATAIMEETFSSAGVRTTIKVTAFDEEAQEIR